MNIKDLTAAIAADLNAGFLPVFDITLDYFLETFETPDDDEYNFGNNYSWFDLYDIVGNLTEKIAGENTPAKIIENSKATDDNFNARFWEFWSNHYDHANGETMEDLLKANRGADFLTYIIMQQQELLLDYLIDKYLRLETQTADAISSKLISYRRIMNNFQSVRESKSF